MKSICDGSATCPNFIFLVLGLEKGIGFSSKKKPFLCRFLKILVNLYFPQISQSFKTESTEFFHREHKDWFYVYRSVKASLKEFYDFDRIKSFSLIGSAGFLESYREHRVFSQRTQRLEFYVYRSVGILKRRYDFDKVKSFYIDCADFLTQRAQSFSQRTKRFL